MFHQQLPEYESIASQGLQELQQGNLQKAWLLFQAAYERGGQNKGIVHVGFGGIYEKQNAWDKAFAAYDYAVSCEPTSSAYNNRGRMYLTTGQLEPAIFDFEEAIRRQPNNAKAYFNLGAACLQQSQSEKSLPFFKKALEFGYPLAQSAIITAQKRIANPDGQNHLMEDQPPEKQQFPNAFLLAKFAYRLCGSNLYLSLVGEPSEQKILSQQIWNTDIEKLGEFGKSGFKGEWVCATLEFFEPSSFLIRITTPLPETHELSLWRKREIDGVPNETFFKQVEHTWRVPQNLLLEKLTEILDSGIIKKQERTLIYE